MFWVRSGNLWFIGVGIVANIAEVGIHLNILSNRECSCTMQQYMSNR